ncbi:DUF2804 domain-containing protein [Butyrivibrio sp. WCE2006]|uniref:DUF2804 domain-containing protein n=1 Tax=Butyrivibrio sp. WCE2006 TaxID=1410611 RepID=UPI0005D1A423|nr:DUF2804 domain-containing protein [Butyrivibrio sp. WCE2006]
MSRNHEVTTNHPLLGSDGNLVEPGWSRSLVQEYDRSMIKAPKWRIKEWDYYLVLSDSFAGAFTISDDGYIGLQSVSLLVFDDKPWEHTETVLNAFPMGKLSLPSSSTTGITKYSDNRLQMKFEVNEGKRRITCHFDNFYTGKPFECDISLNQPDMDSMVIATPWNKNHAFYYNQKVNTMRASGYMEYAGQRYEFNPKTDFGTLDWGRGVWTYDNTWYWGSGNIDIDGNSFGFNIGYGFGNTKAATENVLFYNGKVHKLDDITFHLPEKSYLEPWKFTSSDKRFEMDFVPVLDRSACLDYKLIVSDQHQVFGKMSGTAVLDDGTKISVKDMMCFAEKVHNRY